MNCISIRQPWAWAILFLGKPVENRDWQRKNRGRTLIHTGKKFDKQGAEWIENTFKVHVPTDLPTGGIVGSVNIVNCVDRFRSKWFFGKFGYVLKDPVPLPFVPCNGSLGFYNVDYIYPLRNPLSEGLMGTQRRTWSGQHEEHAWHWNRETYQLLGNIIYLLSTGLAESRTKAYHAYIDLKGWFFEHEFEEYITKLDKWRVSEGAEPIRDMIKEVYREMQPATSWKALNGTQYSDIMPLLNELVPEKDQQPNGKLSTVIIEKPPVVQPVVLPEKVVKPSKKIIIEQLQLELF